MLAEIYLLRLETLLRVSQDALNRKGAVALVKGAAL